MPKNFGKLFIVPTPIGNFEDITLRAIRVLKEVDFIICEEFKVARKLLSKLEIPQKDLMQINEHNENDNFQEIITNLKNGKSAALISDAGTPIFSDPGEILLASAIQNKIHIIPLPGANSVITALSAAGINLNSFKFAGWLPVKSDLRKLAFAKIKKTDDLIILMETPYRLLKILEEIAQFLGEEQFIILAYRLTFDDEFIYRGIVKKVLSEAKKRSLKGEFVLIIDNRKNNGR